MTNMGHFVVHTQFIRGGWYKICWRSHWFRGIGSWKKEPILELHAEKSQKSRLQDLAQAYPPVTSMWHHVTVTSHITISTVLVNWPCIRKYLLRPNKGALRYYLINTYWVEKYTWSKFLSARCRMIATICSRDTGCVNLGSIFFLDLW